MVSHSSNTPDILRIVNHLPKYEPQVFIDWLTERMNKTGVRETARLVGISHPTISDILGGGIGVVEQKTNF